MIPHMLYQQTKIGQDDTAVQRPVKINPIGGEREKEGERERGEENSNVSGMLQFEECLQLQPTTAPDLMSDFRIVIFTACFSAGLYYVTSTLTSGVFFFYSTLPVPLSKSAHLAKWHYSKIFIIF